MLQEEHLFITLSEMLEEYRKSFRSETHVTQVHKHKGALD